MSNASVELFIVLVVLLS